MSTASPASQKIRSVLDRAGLIVEEYARLILALVLLIVFLFSLGYAADAYFWYDEFIIVHTAMLPSWRAIWTFYAHGLDTVGPISALVVYAALKLPFGPELDGRLPSIFALFVLLGSTYLFVRRRYPAGYALAALVLLFAWPLAPLAWTAKGYMLEFGSIGFAMLCWQSALYRRYRPWSVVGIWFGLAVAISAHVFAGFVLVAFAGAQAVRDRSRKSIDWPVWIALLSFPFVLLPTLPGNRLAAKVYAGTFWAQPSLARLGDAYAKFFDVNQRYVACVVIWLAISILFLGSRSPREATSERSQGFSAPEWVLVVLLTFLPCYALIGSYPLHVYRDVYVDSFIIGFSITTMALLAEQARRSAAGGAVLFALMFMAFLLTARRIPAGARVLLHPYSAHTNLQMAYQQQPWVQQIEHSDLPVVAGDHFVYTELEFYGTPDLKKRLFYLTDISEIKEYSQSTTAQLNFLNFGKALSYNTEDISNFLPTNPHFLMVLGTDRAMWLPQFLLHEEREGRARLTLVGPEYVDHPIYDTAFRQMPPFAGIRSVAAAIQTPSSRNP
ncbi:MAG: hypothetical protein ACRYFU_15355 [Janthinobacterium lividum]